MDREANFIPAGIPPRAHVAASGNTGIAVWRMDRSPPALQRLGWKPQAYELSLDGTLLAGQFGKGIEVRRSDGNVVVLGERDSQFSATRPVRIDPAGRRVLSVLPGVGLRVWDIERRAAVPVPAEVPRPAETADLVWFGPDPDTLVMFSDNELTVWPRISGPATTLTTTASHARVSGDGRRSPASTANSSAGT